MTYTKDHKTLDLFDPFPEFGSKRKQLLEQSWAGLFRNEILPKLPVHLLTEYFHEQKGRPSKELYAMLGLMILQQGQDLTDDAYYCPTQPPILISNQPNILESKPSTNSYLKLVRILLE